MWIVTHIDVPHTLCTGMERQRRMTFPCLALCAMIRGAPGMAVARDHLVTRAFCWLERFARTRKDVGVARVCKP